MAGALLDTEPLLAYLYPREKNHDWAVEQFDVLDLPLLTCEPVLTEACFLPGRVKLPAARVLEILHRGVVRIELEVQSELTRLRELMERYGNLPMSFGRCLPGANGGDDRVTDLHPRQRLRDLSSARSPAA